MSNVGGQVVRIPLWRFEFKSRWRLQFFCKIYVWKKARLGPFKKQLVQLNFNKYQRSIEFFFTFTVCVVQTYSNNLQQNRNRSLLWLRKILKYDYNSTVILPLWWLFSGVTFTATFLVLSSLTWLCLCLQDHRDSDSNPWQWSRLGSKCSIKCMWSQMKWHNQWRV